MCMINDKKCIVLIFNSEATNFIKECGNLMNLGYATMHTAIVYMHRFYMFHSFKTFPRFVTACSCLFLAGKVVSFVTIRLNYFNSMKNSCRKRHQKSAETSSEKQRRSYLVKSLLHSVQIPRKKLSQWSEYFSKQ